MAAFSASHRAGFDLNSSTDATSYVTPSDSPTANRWLRVHVSNSKGTTPDLPGMSGGGLTYIQEHTRSTGTMRVTVFYVWTGASPGSFAITADFSGQTQTACEISVEELDGLDTNDPTIQHKDAATTNQLGVTVTPDTAPGAGNPVIGSCYRNDNEAIDPDSGFTELVDLGHSAPNMRYQVMYKASAVGTTITWSDTGANENSNWIAIAEELRLGSDSVNCGLITETESLFAVAVGLGVAQIIETEIVQALGNAQIIVPMITETESVFQLAVGLGLAQQIETETVFSANPIQFKPRISAGGLVYLFGDLEGVLNLAQIVETETVFQVGLGQVVPLIVESEVLFVVVPSASPGPPTGLAQIVETETVFAIVHGVGLAQIIEQEFPLALLTSGGTPGPGGGIIDAVTTSTGTRSKVHRTRM